MTTRTITLYARIGLSLSAALLLICASARLADAAPKRLGVVAFRGPGEGATRNAVMKAAKANKFQVVGAQQISKAASKLKVKLDSNDAFMGVAKELGISAFVTGEVTKKKATLTVRTGADGSVAAEASWTGPNPRKLSAAVGKTFWRRLGSAIDRAKAPSGAKAAVVAEEEAAPETGADDPGDDDKGKGKDGGGDNKKPVAAASDDSGDDSSSRGSSKKKKKGDDESEGDGEEGNVVSEKAEPDDDDGGAGPEALVLSAGPRLVSRSLTYVQDIYRGNAKYSLAVAPELGLNVDFYPAALSGGRGFASNVGLTAGLTYMLPVVKSDAPNPSPPAANYGTYALQWSIGAKVRLPLGVFGTVAYGSQRYQLTPTGGAVGIGVPAVDYRYVRIGTGGRFQVAPDITVMANLAYLHCLSLGQIRSAAYFPKATCGAIEGGAGVGYRISSLLEVQAGVDIRRYGLNFHVTVADAQDPNRKIAGGAVDQYLMGYVAVAVILGGSGKGGGGSHAEAAAEEEEAPKKAKEDDEEGAEGEAAEEEAPPPPKPSKKKKADSLDL